MGMNFSPMYQPTSTKTINVDGDLNLNPYDLLATDVKCDTVEATEFVGGVGNFESALVSGGVDVSGILHAENTLQVDGNMLLEGSINNVNITDEGAITTSKSITATGGFEGYLLAPVTAATSGQSMMNVSDSGNISVSKSATVTLKTFTVSPTVGSKILGFGVKNGTYMTGGNLKVTVNVTMSRGNCDGDILLNGTSIGSVYQGSDVGLSTSVTLTGGPVKAGSNTISYKNKNSAYGGTVSMNAFTIYYGYA